MASVDTRPVTIPFRSPRKDAKVWVLSDVNDWQPREMTDIDEGYEHTFQVSKDRQNLFYKFRIGDWDYANDPEAPSVPDGFGGVNNRYDIPTVPEPPVEIVPLLEESTPAAAVAKPSLELKKPEPASRQPDIEDEAYHSSDSATPKVSRRQSGSTHYDAESVSSASSVLPAAKASAAQADRGVEEIAAKLNTSIVEPIKETLQESLPVELERKQGPKSNSKTQVAPAQKKKQNLPVYLGLAAITVAVMAYFLRIVQYFVPLNNERRIRGPITNALKTAAIMLVAVATVIETIVEETLR